MTASLKAVDTRHHNHLNHNLPATCSCESRNFACRPSAFCCLLAAGQEAKCELSLRARPVQWDLNESGWCNGATQDTKAPLSLTDRWESDRQEHTHTHSCGDTREEDLQLSGDTGSKIQSTILADNFYSLPFKV